MNTQHKLTAAEITKRNEAVKLANQVADKAVEAKFADKLQTAMTETVAEREARLAAEKTAASAIAKAADTVQVSVPAVLPDLTKTDQGVPVPPKAKRKAKGKAEKQGKAVPTGEGIVEGYDLRAWPSELAFCKPDRLAILVARSFGTNKAVSKNELALAVYLMPRSGECNVYDVGQGLHRVLPGGVADHKCNTALNVRGTWAILTQTHVGSKFAGGNPKPRIAYHLSVAGIDAEHHSKIQAYVEQAGLKLAKHMLRAETPELVKA